jgi:hypothetical protein
MRSNTYTMGIRRITAVLAALVVLASSGIGLVRAQEQQGGSGLQISPTRTELNIQPGEVKDFTVTIKNVTQGDITVATFLNDFNADGETGQPKLVVDGSPRLPTSLQPFIKGIEDFDLRAGETKEVKFTLDVPTSYSAGGYFGALRFVALPKGDDRSKAERQVALNASVASIVLVQVEGNILESINVEKVEIRHNDKPSTLFINKPNKVAIDIQNKGNSFSKPFGTVQVLGMNGSEVYSYELNNKDPRGNILPLNSRTFVDDLQGIKSPGRYTVIANVTYGSGGEIVSQKVSFWYIPLWMVAVVVVLLVAIGGFVYMRYRGGGKPRRRKL